MLARRSPIVALSRQRYFLSTFGLALAWSAFLSAAPARAETDLAAAAPWQVPPEVRATGEPSRMSDDVEDAASSPEDDSCGSCCDLGPCYMPCRFWFRGEYLAMWGKSVHLPAMAANDLEGTNVVFGNQTVDQGLRSGARFSLGCWLTQEQNAGFEVTYLFLGAAGKTFTQDSSQYSILTRPYYDAETFSSSSLVLANPDEQTGSLSTKIRSELQSLEASYRHVLFQQGTEQIDGLIGYRYGRLAEGLAIDGSTTIIDLSPFASGTVIATADLFNTNNEFNGGQLGIVAKSRHCRWTLEVLGKLAMGSMHSTSTVSGSTTVTPPTGSPTVTSGGFYALGTNSGNFDRTGFAVMPEVGLNLGYDLTPRLKATCGYNFLYLSRVVRPADQLDTNLNATQFSGGTLSGYPAPEAKFVLSDYWAQGLTAGLECRF
ncbi:MAG: BBP7 family outer membrane beta-barrel protein [Thermoguttaceae bacterium]